MKAAKFDIQDMLPIGLTLVVLGIALAYGLQVMGETRDDMGEEVCAARGDAYVLYDSTNKVCYEPVDSNTSALSGDAQYNATGYAIEGVSKLPEKLPTIVGVIVAAIIIGILVRYMLTR